MSGLAFFDTNIFLYSDDPRSPEIRTQALRLIAEHQRSAMAMTSLQVLQEYFVAATRKLNIDPSLAQQKVEVMSRLRVVRLSEADVIAAIELHRLHQVSFGNAMIIHAARIGGAVTLYSEDLQTSRDWGGLRVVNPFHFQ